MGFKTEMKYSETPKVVLQPEYWCFLDNVVKILLGVSVHVKRQHQNTKTMFRIQSMVYESKWFIVKA
jgi:hypothetical protein